MARVENPPPQGKCNILKEGGSRGSMPGHELDRLVLPRVLDKKEVLTTRHIDFASSQKPISYMIYVTSETI